MKKKENRLPLLEEGLLRALSALDNQVAREMQRDPAKLSEKGLRKDEPYEKRVESLTAFLLNTLGEDEIHLDGILILSQALSKTLQFVCEDLGNKGLGKLRTSYCQTALTQISENARRGLDALGGRTELM